MERQSQAKSCVICFRRWSRKSYAVFSSMGKHVRIGVLCLSCSILSLPGFSRETRDTLQTQLPSQLLELEEVVVSAQLGPVVQSELMRVVQLITRAQIEQSPAGDLAGLLERVRGVDIRKRGPFGMQADVGIRGGSFDQTMVLLNGVNITDPQTGHHNLNIPVDVLSIERVEVLQGSGARLFGPNAFSGAINIITRSAGSQPALISLEGGQFGYASGSLSGGFSTGSLGHFISLNGLRSAGFAPNTDFTAANLFYRGSADLKRFTLDAQAAMGTKAFGANSFYTPVFPDQFEETQTNLVSLQLIPRGRVNLRPSLYWRRHHDRFELFRHEAPEWYIGHNYHMSDVAGASLKWMQPWGQGLSSVALDYRMEHIYSTVLGKLMDEPRKADKYEDVFYTNSFRRRGFSIMGEHILYLGEVTLSAGTLAWVNPELGQGFSLFPGLDAAWQMHPSLRFFASLSRTLRLPTFTDLFYSGPTNLGNPGLLPEKAIAGEAGLKASMKGLQIELAAFRRWGKDMIDWGKYPGEDRWKSMNLTKVNVTGLEGGFSTLPGTLPMVLSVHYSFMTAGKSSGHYLSYYVMDFLKHKADLSLELPLGKNAGTTWNISYLDRQGGFVLYENGSYQGYVDFQPWWSADARAFYRLGQMELFTEVNNLLNQQTVSIANVPQPGRWARMGVTWKIIGEK